MNYILVIASLFLGSVSLAVYNPDNNEQTVYQCDHSTLNVQVIRTFEDQYKIRLSPNSEVGFELFIEELVTRAESQDSQFFMSEKVILKLTTTDQIRFFGTLLVLNDPKQPEQFDMNCSIVYTIMKSQYSEI